MKKDEDLEEITLEKIEKLGKIVKHDKSIYPKTMLKKFVGCGKGYKCSGQKAGSKKQKKQTTSFAQSHNPKISQTNKHR